MSILHSYTFPMGAIYITTKSHKRKQIESRVMGLITKSAVKKLYKWRNILFCFSRNQ